MSSAPPSSFNYPSPHAKRQSRQQPPRPLHLLDIANLDGTPGASSSSASSSSKRTSFASPVASPSPKSAPIDPSTGTPQRSRRQNSIPYFSPHSENHREREWKRRSAQSSRSGSQTRGQLDSPFVEKAIGLGLQVEGEKPRPKLTLAEQHADLLSFIAQKEAYCLELRTQLAAHEEELAELKRKWERIVNRGVERENSISNANTAALRSLTSPATLSFEGLKGGVQEVSRLLSVATGTGSRPPSATPSPLLSSKSLPRHSARDSNSSASTSRTTTTSSSTGAHHRLSQCSSATSLDEDVDTVKQHVEPPPNGNSSIHSSPQELIITDTGATPTVSPNPAFLEQKERRKRRKDLLDVSVSSSGGASVSDGPDDAWDVWGANEVGMSGSVKLQDPPKGKAAAVPPSSSIPGSSIVGLGSLASPQAQVSAWMDSVGKKLGELQKSPTVTALSKSQKRASLILSDVSQSIASALTEPPPSRPLTRASTQSLSLSRSGSLKRSSTTSKVSLIDADDDDDKYAKMGYPAAPKPVSPQTPSMAVMTPDVKVTAPSSSAVMKTTSKLEKRKSRTIKPDDDWNW
ncbi:hypothetical protein CC1G_12364 [Coprinopsis cinerea okayama7|uniref:Uncharacterized protein n=1 Tax=Coprinopsis cinerea (strain Okayama-7 / 130 / ATCC MYA-4618 / FGSC 9003) TaxID=240176 RepID=A8P574_COPC7|nr:hypothetical protein CC1G_12364 [Coprinopsis cinerea okayama7\|eukprot:XP_001838890.1 hypothetical protein CC1G_12364 [Coprinopsis cinerea okayama7\